MLEQMVKKLSGVVLGGVIALLSLVFVLQFGGPQAQGCGGGGGAAQVAAKVYDAKISQADLRAAFLLAGGDRISADRVKQYKLRDMVLYGLVEEKLLAREARALGFHITEDQVMTQVIEDSLVHVPMSVDAGPFLPQAGARRYDFTDSSGAFNKDYLKRFIQGGLQRSVRDFAESQIDGTLAQRMRDTIAAAVTVGDGEVWDAYVRETERATLKYARFSPVYYGQTLSPTDADLDAWAKSNAETLDAEYEKQKHRYTGLEKQVRARHILIKVAAEASDEDKAAARDRASALLKRVKAGEDFAALARANSEDAGSAKKGGDLGYNPKGRMVAPFDEAQFGMEVGQVSELVESNFGLHIIKVEAIREGDVPVDEAKRELAQQAYRDEKAAALAKQAADAALAKLKGGMTLEALEAEWTAPAGDDGARDPLSPQFRDTRPFGRTEAPIPGAFDSRPLAEAAFALEENAPLGEAPMQLGEDFFIYQLETKTLAEKDKFDADTERRLREGLLDARRQQAVANHVRILKQKAEAAKSLTVDEAFLDG